MKRYRSRPVSFFGRVVVTLRPGVWLGESFLSAQVVLPSLFQILLTQMLGETGPVGW